MGSVYRREFLYKPKLSFHNCPGFAHRSINRLAFERPSANSLSIETNYLKRDMKRDPNNITPLLEYQLWLEAGKLDKINFKIEQADPDVQFNSNLWRNFRSTSGLIDDNKKGNVSEAISTLYPINIPSPSQVGTNTLSNFFDQNRYNMFKTDKSYNLAVARVENEATLMKFLRLKSELRNPPLDYDGSILPPKNFKKYPPVSKAPLLRDKTTLSDNDYIYRRQRLLEEPDQFLHKNIDMHSSVDFSSLEKATKKRLKSKLVHRENHPDYAKVLFQKQIKSGLKKYSLGHFEVD